METRFSAGFAEFNTLAVTFMTACMKLLWRLDIDVSLQCLTGNVPPGHANMAAQHVINMPTSMNPAMYVHHHTGTVCNVVHSQ